MTTIQTRARIDDEGNVVVRVGKAQAGAEVAVTIEPLTDSPRSRAEYVAEIERLAGSIDDPSFVEPPDPPPAPLRALDE